MRCHRHTKCDSIARIPSAARAHSIEQHVGPQLDSLCQFSRSVKAVLPRLSKRNDAEGGRDHPARCSRNPAPAELGWIELNLVVDRAEFPTPQPRCFTASDRKSTRLNSSH